MTGFATSAIRQVRHHIFYASPGVGDGRTRAFRKRFNQSVFISTDNGFLFVKNEKAGNNSARMTLQTLEAGGQLPRRFRSQRRYSGPLLQPSDLRIKRLEDVNALGLFRFTVVRDPYARLLSCFLNKIEKFDQKQKLFKMRAGLAPSAAATFAEFVKAVALQNPLDMDPHWRVQYVNVFADIISFDRIIKFEAYGHEFPSAVGNFFSDYRAVDVHKGQHNAEDKLDDYYTDELIDIVNQVYAVDFETFGYPMRGKNSTQAAATSISPRRQPLPCG